MKAAFLHSPLSTRHIPYASAHVVHMSSEDMYLVAHDLVRREFLPQETCIYQSRSECEAMDVKWAFRHKENNHTSTDLSVRHLKASSSAFSTPQKARPLVEGRSSVNSALHMIRGWSVFGSTWGRLGPPSWTGEIRVPPTNSIHSYSITLLSFIQAVVVVGVEEDVDVFA